MSEFKSANLKLDRARLHIAAIEEAQNAFLKTAFYEIKHEKDDAGYTLVRVTRIDPIPEIIPVVIGDAAHNIRSALDHIAFAVARPSTDRERDDVHFPLFSSPKAFADNAARRLPGAPKEAVDVIDGFQPHRFTIAQKEKVLSAIQTINNWDKHKAVSVVNLFANYGYAHMLALDREPVPIEIYANQVLKAGAVIAKLPPQNAAQNGTIFIQPSYGDDMGDEVAKCPTLVPLKAALDHIEGTIMPALEKFA